MKFKQKLHVLGAERFNIEGTGEIARVFVLEDESTMDDPDRVGKMTMVAKCPYDLIDKIRHMQFPALAECVVEFAAGKQKSASMFISEIITNEQKSPNEPKKS